MPKGLRLSGGIGTAAVP